MRKIKRIFIHCSAGYGDVESQKRYWKSLGWKSPGYHREVSTDGTIHNLADFEQVVNGVKYYNSTSIHICYQGGVRKDNYKIAEDTRTPEQKKGIYTCLEEALDWLFDNGADLCNIQILGHRDISEDKNLNGKIDSWERIKECPCFDAIPEYSWVIDNYINNRPLDFKP
jgi:N-acetylmuramoyl-L-alanine amidase